MAGQLMPDNNQNQNKTLNNRVTNQRPDWDSDSGTGASMASDKSRDGPGPDFKKGACNAVLRECVQPATTVPNSESESHQKNKFESPVSKHSKDHHEIPAVEQPLLQCASPAQGFEFPSQCESPDVSEYSQPSVPQSSSHPGSSRHPPDFSWKTVSILTIGVIILLLTSATIGMISFSYSKDAEPKPSVSVMLLGNNAALRRTVGNVVLGREAFMVVPPSSGFQQCEQKNGVIGQRHITVFDTSQVETISETTKRCAKISHLQPNVFLWIVEVETVRDEIHHSKWIQEKLNKLALQFTIVLLSSEQKLDVESVNGFLNSPLWANMSGLGVRYHVMNSNRKEPSALLAKIDDLLQEQTGYSLAKSLHVEVEEAAMQEIREEERRKYEKREELLKEDEKKERKKIEKEIRQELERKKLEREHTIRQEEEAKRAERERVIRREEEKKRVDRERVIRQEEEKKRVESEQKIRQEEEAKRVESDRVIRQEEAEKRVQTEKAVREEESKKLHISIAFVFVFAIVAGTVIAVLIVLLKKKGCAQ